MTAFENSNVCRHGDDLSLCVRCYQARKIDALQKQLDELRWAGEGGAPDRRTDEEHLDDFLMTATTHHARAVARKIREMRALLAQRPAPVTQSVAAAGILAAVGNVQE